MLHCYIHCGQCFIFIGSNKTIAHGATKYQNIYLTLKSKSDRQESNQSKINV